MLASLLNMSLLTENAAVSGSAGGILMILYLAVIFGVFYFLAIRPQRKEQKRVQTMLSQMEVGDVVVTTSGFYGIVISVSEEDCIVEFGSNKNCRIPMRKTAIAEIEKPADSASAPAPTPAETKKDAEEKKGIKGLLKR